MTSHNAWKVKVQSTTGLLVENVYALHVTEHEDTIVCHGLFRNDRDNFPRLDPNSKVIFNKHSVFHWATCPVTIIAIDNEHPEVIEQGRKAQA